VAAAACSQWRRFCAASSATYLVNDLLDREADSSTRPSATARSHPANSAWERPSWPGCCLVAAAAVAAFALGGWFPALLGGYLALTLLYSALLKELVFVDVLVVAAGFVLRVVGGAIAIDVAGLALAAAVRYLLALYLALGKRRAELALLGEDAGTHRVVLATTRCRWSTRRSASCWARPCSPYTLYTLAPETVAKVGSEGLMATVPVVLYGLFRYLYLLHRHELGGSPTRVLLIDRPLLACVVVWLIVAAVVVGVG